MSENKVEVPSEKRCNWKTIAAGNWYTSIKCMKCYKIVTLDPEDEIAYIREERFKMCASHALENPNNPEKENA